MKHYIPLLIIILFSMNAIAQPTLTAATNNMVAGDVFTAYICDTTGYSGVIDGGASGAGVTWNFASLDTNSIENIAFLSSTGTLYADSFPGCNLVSINWADYNYYITNTSYWGMIGTYDSSASDAEYYSKPLTFLNYPCTYNNIVVDTIIMSDPSAGFYTTYIDSNIADAYGTLILPSGTYTNVLRMHVVTYGTDSTSFSLVKGRYEQYYWYQPGFHLYLMNMIYDTSEGSKYISAMVYYSQITQGIVSINKNDVALEISPNPANDVANLKFNITDPQSTIITISDVTGKTVSNINSTSLNTGLNQIAYPVSDLPDGVYLIHLISDGSSVKKKFVVVR